MIDVSKLKIFWRALSILKNIHFHILQHQILITVLHFNCIASRIQYYWEKYKLFKVFLMETRIITFKLITHEVVTFQITHLLKVWWNCNRYFRVLYVNILNIQQAILERSKVWLWLGWIHLLLNISAHIVQETGARVRDIRQWYENINTLS